MTSPIFVRPATPLDCPAIAHIQVDSYRTAYAPLLPAEYLAAFTYEEQEQDWRDLLAAGRAGVRLWVAEDEVGEIVGYLLARLTNREGSGYDAEIVALHVRPGFHRRGAGRALMAEAARKLHALGCRTLHLWVLDGNPAAGFYERLGGRLSGDQFFEIAEFSLRRREVGYAWDDLTNLLENCV